MTTATTYRLTPTKPVLNYSTPTLYCATDNSTKSMAPSTGLHPILRGHRWQNRWELRSNLLVETHFSEGQMVAVTYLSLEEYGIGDTVNDAIHDLLTSLSDYRQSLQEIEPTLGEPALADLETLKTLIKDLNQ